MDLTNVDVDAIETRTYRVRYKVAVPTAVVDDEEELRKDLASAIANARPASKKLVSVDSQEVDYESAVIVEE